MEYSKYLEELIIRTCDCPKKVMPAKKCPDKDMFLCLPEKEYINKRKCWRLIFDMAKKEFQKTS